jgi:hypothetical protein
VIVRPQFHRLYPAALLAAIATLTGNAFAQCTNNEVPGKFYEYYIIAQTGSCNGNNFTSLGSNPSINDFGQVGFMAQASALTGNALWVGDGHMHPAATPINPSEIGSSEIYDSAVQLSTSLSNVQLVTKDSITTTSPATTSIRVWNTATPDSFRYAARGGPSQKFGAVFPYPSINKTGETAFCALDSSNPTIKYLVEVSPTGAVSKAAVNVSVGEPMLDDNGNVLLYQLTTEPAGGFQVMLYPKGLGSPTVIADYNNFSSIDTAPGISHDGMVVAFEGNLNADGAMAYSTTTGPGIFAATNQGGGVWAITRVTGLQVPVATANGNIGGLCTFGQACQPAGELGFDASGNAIYFNPSGYGVGTRVGAMNLGLGAAGIANDSFVISFVGTPTEASRPNPVLNNGTPLFFSAQQGLWTIRVDVENQLSPPNTLVYHPRSAIPVVQIDDKVSGNVVNAIGPYDDIANAAKDESGNIRTMRRGDHRIAFWASTAGGTQFIARANHLDTDQDGLLDHWETTGIDMDQDGVVDLNLANMGANYGKRDVFLEIDWLLDQPGYSFKPAPGVVSAAPGQTIAPLQAMFNNAPALTGEMYGLRIDGSAPASISKGITLHVDGGPNSDIKGGPLSINMGSGPLDGGQHIGASGGPGGAGLAELLYFGQPNSITIPGVNTRAFQDAKDNFFGSQDKDGRELAFHYVVFGDYYQARTDANKAYSWHVASAGVNYLDSASAVPATNHNDVIKITGGTGEGEYEAVDGTNPPNEIVITTPWAVQPDNTSTFSVFSSSSGLSELYINPTPDFNTQPGNDLIVTFGSAALGFFDGIVEGMLSTGCDQWRTLAHELGHTLGLRHGGIDNNPYKDGTFESLMSYDYQLKCVPPSPVQSYSSTTTVFDDWANLQGDFSDSMMHLGNTLGIGFGSFDEVDQQAEELGIGDYIAQNGPFDHTPPTVAVQTPAANANVGLTLPLSVTVNATDNIQVASVTVSFDVTGTGTQDIIAAKASGTNLYKATYPDVSGSPGTRTITAAAVDSSGNSSSAGISVNVEEPNPAPAIVSLVPPNATHGGAGFTLTVNGANFVSGCTVEWNGTARTTAFVNSGQVTAQIRKADIATAGTATVTVKNPAPGGGVSNSKTFTIN